MIKKKTIEFECCDFCPDGEGTYRCDHCKRTACLKCQKENMKNFPHDLVNGYEAGRFCTDCVSELTTNGGDELFSAHQDMIALRERCNRFYEEVAAENGRLKARIEQLRSERGLR